MPERARILYTIESMIGFRFDERKLSMQVQEEVLRLMRAERRVAALREDVELVNRRRRNNLILLFGTLFVGALGLVLGVTSLWYHLFGVAGPLLSIVAGLGLFDVDYFLLRFDRRLRLEGLKGLGEIAELSVAYDAGLESVSRRIASEIPEFSRPID